MCALDRNTPRTCTPENASTAINGDNSETKEIFVADLAIHSVTREVDFSRSVPIESYLANPDMVKENMQQLLGMILGFFEAEVIKVENGQLKEEEMLFAPYDLQTDDTNSKPPIRQLPAGFNRRRA